MKAGLMPELFNYSPPIIMKAGVGPDPDVSWAH